MIGAGIPRIAAIAASNFAQHPAHTSVQRFCQAGWVYDNITVLGYPLVQLGSIYENVNDTDSGETSTFTEANTRTVALVTSRGLLVSTSVVLASVTVSTSKSVVQAITTTSGNTVSFIVPAHKIAHAEYGVYEVEVSGHYYYRDQFCSTPFFLDEGEVISWCPWYAGWHTWVSGPEQDSVPNEQTGVPGSQGGASGSHGSSANAQRSASGNQTSASGSQGSATSGQSGASGSQGSAANNGDSTSNSQSGTSQAGP